MDETQRLTFGKRLSYGVGHVLNDLCASMWFSYLLVYLHYVLQFSNKLAGYLLLLGQVVDAVCTPLIGYESDRTSGCGNYGKRKTWHLIGTIAVVCSFPFIFNKCVECVTCQGDFDSGQPCWVQFIYYAPFVAIFQFGWASTQISHLSLIPEITSDESERVELNALRYAFTVMANLTVYCVAWILLGQASGVDLMPSDQHVFTILTVVVIAVGFLFSLIFHVGTKEKPRQLSIEGTMLAANSPSTNYMTWKDWFSEIQFYQVGFLYMFTRLVVNLSQVYMPMYITGTLNLHKLYIAIVPLVTFVSGFFVSFLMKPLNARAGRKMTYVIGAMFVAGSCVWMWFLHEERGYLIIGVAVCLGIGTSTILVSSLSITSDLIGVHCNSGAFVYGAMSFTDKLSNGIAIALVQYFHPCTTQACCPDCVWYYRDVMALVVGAMTILAFVMLLTLAPSTIGRLRRDASAGANEEERKRLLGTGARPVNNEDCCDFGTCFGSSSDAQAHGVLQGEYTPVPNALNRGQVSDYGSVNSDSVEVRSNRSLDSQSRPLMECASDQLDSELA